MIFKKGDIITNGKVTGEYFDTCYHGIALQDYSVHGWNFRLCTKQEIEEYLKTKV